MQIHNRLDFDEDGRAALYFFDTCVHTIRTIPLLIHDTVKVEDVDTKQEDHAADSVRYFCMARPMPARKKVKPKEIPYSPLDEDTHNLNNYGFIGTRY